MGATVSGSFQRRHERTSLGDSMLLGLSFTVLGPVTAHRHGTSLDLGAPQQRAMLAALLLREGTPVMVEELAGALWAEDAQASRETTIRTYAYRLRRALGANADEPPIRSVPGGYVLTLGSDALDLTVFRRHQAAAEAATRAGDRKGAAAELEAALALWKGMPLAGLPGPYAERQRGALERLRTSVHDALLQARLDSGNHVEVVDKISETVIERPFDERLRGMYMLALYRSGRQADALAAFHDARRLLVDELGVEPGPALMSLHERILRADRDLLVVTAEEPVVRPGPSARPPFPEVAQLPPDLGVFIGRTRHLESATRLLADTRGDAGPAIFAVSGTAGVGKTTFAVHWARQVAGDFPDGHVYVDLHGFDPSGVPTHPQDAVRIVLQSLGMTTRDLPTHPEAQHALYRSLMSQRRLILLLDNARDAQQVRPLLAGGPGCLILVTSRVRLGSVVAADGAHPISLDVLSSAEACDLLVRRLGAERVAAEPVAVEEILQRCARLPLALAVVAARAAVRPDFQLADIAVELGDDRLDVLQSGDPSTDTRSVFSWSYTALSHSTARLFRLLALHPGPEISIMSVAALAGTSMREARRQLAELSDAVLLEERRPGRYSWHDLLRTYANEVIAETDPPADRRLAQRRLFDHLLRSAANAAEALNPHRSRYTAILETDAIPAAEFDNYADALSWTAREHAVLLKAVAAADSNDFPAYAWHLAHELETFQLRAGFEVDMTTAQQIALRSAAQLDDLVMQAQAHHSLAKADDQLSRYEVGYANIKAAVETFRRAGHRVGESNCLISLGDAAASLFRMKEAAVHYEAAIALCREVGNMPGLAAALNNFALRLIENDALDRGLGLCRDALVIWRAIDDRHGLAHSTESLGLAYLLQGRHDLAIPALREAAACFEELGVTFWAADSLAYLGDAHAANGDRKPAVEAWRRAVELLAEVGKPDAVALRERVLGLLAAHGAASD